MSVPDDISKAATSGWDHEHSMQKEVFLIRRASDYVSLNSRKASNRFGRDISGSSFTAGWGAGKLVEGIGVDTRKYIEGLLNR
jgi:hypothetical protein